MKKNFLLLLFTFLIISCNSVKHYNSNINKLRSAEDLRSDVDYVYKKLQKLHPRLYLFISKTELDRKFDSLKATITKPMTSNEFYFCLSPVLSTIGEGHLSLLPLVKKNTKNERKEIKRSTISPLKYFQYEIHNNRVYISRNNSRLQDIKPGTELVSVNNIRAQEIIDKYRRCVSTDGYNTTNIIPSLAHNLPFYYYIETGFADSLRLDLNYRDSVWQEWIYRRNRGKNNKLIFQKSDTIKKPDFDEKERRYINGYNKYTGKYSKELTFYPSDSSIAIMKVRDFTEGNFKKFLKNSFIQLDSMNIQYLILDLRDNQGGLLKDAYRMYSYLADSDFVFMDKSEVVSRTSLLHRNFFKFRSVPSLPFYILKLPFVTFFYIKDFIKIKKDKEGRYYFSEPQEKGRPNIYHYSGKMYVIINGESFSATSLLSANIKSAKRATFVGEETGGAYNGFSAGFMPEYRLPRSKLNIYFGLIYLQPYYRQGTFGRGIFPDKEIKHSLNDLIYNVDPEMNWILDDIKGLHKEKPVNSRK